MKKTVLLLVLFLSAFNTFAQEIKYTEDKNLELGKFLAKIHATNSFGFKNHLIKTYVVNNDLGYTKDDLPGAKQFLYISDSELGKEITTKLYKTDGLLNIEVIDVAEVPGGFEVKIAQGPNDDKTDEIFILKTAKKE
ncbi:hypothetical protein EZL74_01840 [Flavobacterium silvisoli]|uniref:Uncharacterized protein n=1 Tax=Flavobacterium silvisoli TaxID=2529433 RepID=A0A4Q9Z4A8_9FLAO|nr:hypothetical protein [Flavobacterium silvisoli]TBX71273.1 hypothetical protein EZL74_01840 [Flavobacterium silvisoli]